MENMETFESVDKIKTRVVGIDIRIEKTTIALVDIRGDIVAQDYFPTTDYPDVNDFLTALSENIFALLEENGGYESVRSIGVSAPCQCSQRQLYHRLYRERSQLALEGCHPSGSDVARSLGPGCGCG